MAKLHLPGGVFTVSRHEISHIDQGLGAGPGAIYRVPNAEDENGDTVQLRIMTGSGWWAFSDLEH